MAMTLISRRLRALLPLFCFAVVCGASDRILVLRADGPDFKGTMEGLKGELGPGFEIEEKIVGDGFGAREAASLVAARRPKAIVLMDNQAIRIHAGAQKVWNDSVPYPPAIALMAVRVDKATAGLRNTTGIIYEVPAVTIFVNLRSLSEEPVLKVGVITRPYMADFVRESAAWCERERIILVPHEVPEERQNVARAVREGIRRLRDRENVDALWILNDNHFLTAEIIREGWIPALERFREPVLVGVENLVAAGTRFGTYAVLPDHYGLGAQAAGMIVRLKEDGWRMDGMTKVEHPLAVIKVLNLEQARRGMRVRQESLLEVDKVIK